MTLLDRQHFETWLRSFPPSFKVGHTGCGESCPLARYLRYYTGRAVHVSGYAWRTTDGENRDLTMWAAQFVHRLDIYYLSGRVTVAECLHVLEGLA